LFLSESEWEDNVLMKVTPLGQCGHNCIFYIPIKWLAYDFWLLSLFLGVGFEFKGHRYHIRTSRSPSQASFPTPLSTSQMPDEVPLFSASPGLHMMNETVKTLLDYLITSMKF
jgi:hypothetical protein